MISKGWGLSRKVREIGFTSNFTVNTVTHVVTGGLSICNVHANYLRTSKDVDIELTERGDKSLAVVGVRCWLCILVRGATFSNSTG